MMAGAVILLVGSLVPAIMGAADAPTWLPNASLVIGYGFLAYGFFLAMRARSGARDTATKRPPEDEETS
jgi:threonine/homoserine/homoserine lactone efflux protein